MSYGLLWFEALMACLFFTRMLVGLGFRRKTRKGLIAICGLGFLTPLVAMGLLVALETTCWLFAGTPGRDLAFAVALAMSYVAIAVVVWVKANRRDEAGVRQACSWPVGRLAVAWLVVLGLTAMTLWNMSLQAQLEIQGLRTEAAALASVLTPRPVADSDNAAILYQQAFVQLKAAGVADDREWDYRKLDPRSPEVEAYLQRQRATLELVRRAADMPGCRFTYDYSKPNIEAVLHELGPMRDCVSLLSIAARAEAARGQPDLALADCRRMYAVGGHIGSSPLLISGLVVLAVDASASQTVGKVLPCVTIPAQLNSLPQSEPQAVTQRFTNTLLSEEAYGLASFCDAGSGVSSGTATPWTRGGSLVMWTVWMRHDVTSYRILLQKIMLMVSRQPAFQASTEFKRLEQEIRAGNAYGPLTRLLAPSLLGTLASLAKAQAARAAMTVACAATRYRLDHGAYPASVDSLVPAYLNAVPPDPFDGRPMRLKLRPDGSIVIYSIGPDGVDDGGQVDPLPNGKHAVDVGVILQMPAGH